MGNNHEGQLMISVRMPRTEVSERMLIAIQAIKNAADVLQYDVYHDKWDDSLKRCKEIRTTLNLFESLANDFKNSDEGNLPSPTKE